MIQELCHQSNWNLTIFLWNNILDRAQILLVAIFRLFLLSNTKCAKFKLSIWLPTVFTQKEENERPLPFFQGKTKFTQNLNIRSWLYKGSKKPSLLWIRTKQIHHSIDHALQILYIHIKQNWPSKFQNRYQTLNFCKKSFFLPKQTCLHTKYAWLQRPDFFQSKVGNIEMCCCYFLTEIIFI